MYRISVIGTGYVGLVTGACLADFGNEVICVDKIADKIARLKELEIPFYEPGLKEVVERNVAEGRLVFSNDLPGAVEKTPVVFIAVGTPTGAAGEADLSAVFEVAKEVATHMQGYRLIVQKSTVPVGTGRQVRETILRHLKGDHPFDVASNPEFLREGSAVQDFTHPNRVVIGTWTARAANILSDIYSPLYLLETPMVKTTVETAELIKYAANGFLATKISFINEMANLCEALGADVQVVAKGMGLDRRIGDKFLHAGPGYGGSCFPKDTRALLAFAAGAGVELPIVRATIETNDRQIDRMIDKCEQGMGGLAGKSVAMLGLSFKPNTDDVREAPALKIAKRLLAAGCAVRAFDPVAMPSAQKALSALKVGANAYEVCEGADAVLLVTEWNEFRRLDLERIRGLLKTPVFIDMKNIYPPERMAALGFRYIGIGRPATSKAATPAAPAAD
ncbi:MAG TPA: UDP-glucose/GDP-mannose dehydrogenase family protein [Candidatus Udaeobacter sp.]|nr:UDP-glucose/GDP-mannose dehydrogenase family protein [Candidatus Udaeobacter sp.]